MQKLGQHFLKNTAVLQSIMDAIDLQSGEVAVEIGPGHGELTTPLMRIAERLHGKVITIEKDRSLIPPLVAIAERGGAELLTIIEGDALKLLPNTIEGLSRYKIVGNIPYYITGKLLRTISELEERPERTVLLIQNEVAKRICAAPPHMNRLAASVQFWADPTIAAFVPKKDFFPQPDVDSAIIVLEHKNVSVRTEQSVDPAGYYRAVRTIFAQPRKTLLNNLTEGSDNGVARGDIVSHLTHIGIDPGIRPQDLDIAQIIAIAKASLWG